MDVVYVLGKGSLCNNDELRYSIRLLEANCADLGNIYVVGESVDFLPGVKFLNMPDTHSKPWKNVLDKVKAVCSLDELSEEFLLMNDDFFALAPFEIESLPFYANKGGNGGNSGPLDFAVHKPIRLNKKFYLNLPIHSGMSTNYSPRSFYCNFYKAPPTYVKDFVLRTGEGLKSFDEQCDGHDWFTIDDITMTVPEFREWLDILAPNASSFETEPAEQ